MIKIICYHENGEAIPDALAEKRAREFLKDDITSGISVSTDNFITAVRCLVSEGFYPHQDVTFSFKDDVISINKYGRLDKWPNGFGDYTDKWLTRLLTTRS